MATNNFDPLKYGAVPIKSTGFDPLKYGAVPIDTEEQPKEKGLLRRMGEGFISSEIATGKMFGTAISAKTQRKNIEETIKRYNETGDKWSEMAKKETDPTRKQLYMKNAQQSYLDGGKVWDDVIGNENLEKGSSVKEVAGAFGGVALDIATAGTYGQAAKLAKTGQLLKPVLKSSIPTVAKEVVATGAKSLAKKSAVGAGIGYGYDVTQSMQNGESLPDILTPGYGTLLGAAIPFGVAGAKLGYKGTKAAVKGVGNVVSKVAQHTADIPDGMVVDYLAKTKKVDSLIAKNATPEQALKIAQSAVRNLRKNMSGEWKGAVDVIKGKYTNKVALDANRLKQVTNIAEKFGDDILNKVDEAGNITRINPKNMSVDDSLTLLKNINELYGKRIVRESAEGIPVRSFKDFFKKNIIDQFGGKDGEIANLYKNYSTKSDILNAADDIVKAYDTKNPIKQSTALGRIKSLFRENKGAYLKAIKDLESEMGVDITSYITASELGKGLTASKVVTAGGAGIFSKKGIIDKVFEAVLFPLTTPKYARQLLKLSTKTEGQTMRQAMGIIEKQPSKNKTILESMFPQEGAESPAAVLNSAKNAGKTIIDTAKQKTLKGSVNNPVSKKGSPTVGKTVYHGTNESFSGFKQPEKAGIYGKGTYFYSDKNKASEYGKNVIEANIEKGKMATNSDFNKALDLAKQNGYKASAKYDKASEILKEKGFIGIKDGDVTVVFDTKNIKSQPLQEGVKTVLYRGSKEDISKSFGEGRAVFMTDNPESAKGYALSRGGKVYSHEFPSDIKTKEVYAETIVSKMEKKYPELFKEGGEWEKSHVGEAMFEANTDALALQELGAVFPKELSGTIRSMGLDGIKTRGGTRGLEYVMAKPKNFVTPIGIKADNFGVGKNANGVVIDKKTFNNVVNTVSSSPVNKETATTYSKAIQSRLNTVPDYKNTVRTGESVIRTNADPHYKVSFDMDTNCPKRKAFENALGYVKNKLGSVSGDAQRYLRTMMAKNGIEVPCQFCFVENPRMIEGLKQQKRVIQLGEYRGEILKMKPEQITELNKHGGLRFQSWTDFDPSHMPDIVNGINDAGIRKLEGGMYSKQADGVEWLAPTNMKINTSLAANVVDGKFVEDSINSMSWEKAFKLREKYDNVGTVLIAKNDEQIVMALNDSNIDHIIPEHIKAIPVKNRIELSTPGSQVSSYEAFQNEKWIDPTKKDKIPLILDSFHEGDKAKYLAYTKKMGLIPKFPQFVDHPNYMKLIGREYGKFGDVTHKPLQPVFNWKKGNDIVESYIKNGGFQVNVDPKVLDNFVSEVKKNGVPVDYIIKGMNLQQTPGLVGKELQMETDAYLKVLTDPKGFVEKYSSKFGNVANADNVRRFFKSYTGENARVFQEPSSFANKMIWRKLMEENKQPFAVIYAGGSGTGKTSAISNLKPLSSTMKNAAGILDGNLSGMSSAMDRINEAIMAGKKPRFIYVYRDPIDSFENGIVKRMLKNKEEMGRIVPIEVMIKNHIGSRDVILELYKNAPEKKAFTFIDNSLGYQNQKLVDINFVKKIRYNEVELRNKLINKVKELYGKGTINKQQLKRYLEK